MVIDLAGFLPLSVVLDHRKRLVFRPFEQISARFGGNVSVLRSIQSYPPLPMSADFSTPLALRRAFTPCPPPISFQAFPQQMATRARFTLVTTRRPFEAVFRV